MATQSLLERRYRVLGRRSPLFYDKPLHLTRGEGVWVYDARFTPDSTTVVAAVRDGVLRSYDLASGFETDLGQAPSTPERMVLSSDGQLAVTGQLTVT